MLPSFVKAKIRLIFIAEAMGNGDMRNSNNGPGSVPPRNQSRGQQNFPNQVGQVNDFSFVKELTRFYKNLLHVFFLI